LYTRSHTRGSLSAELSCTFDVLECVYEEHDPRYVIAVVKNREGSRAAPGPAAGDHFREPEKRSLDPGGTTVHALLDRMESICERLESHERRVLEFFRTRGAPGNKSPLLGVDAALRDFRDLLVETFAVLPKKEAGLRVRAGTGSGRVAGRDVDGIPAPL